MYFELRIPRKGETIIVKEAFYKVVDLDTNGNKITINDQGKKAELPLKNYRVVALFPYFKFW
jgi:hypothetical protein